MQARNDSCYPCIEATAVHARKKANQSATSPPLPMMANDVLIVRCYALLNRNHPGVERFTI